MKGAQRAFDQSSSWEDLSGIRIVLSQRLRRNPNLIDQVVQYMHQKITTLRWLKAGCAEIGHRPLQTASALCPY